MYITYDYWINIILCYRVSGPKFYACLTKGTSWVVPGVMESWFWTYIRYSSTCGFFPFDSFEINVLNIND